MKIGEHELTLEEPDLICLRVVGDFSREETLAMFEIIEPFARGKPYLLWLTDLRRAKTVDSAQRRLFVQRARALPVRGSAFIGAPRHVRYIATVILNAIRLLGGPDTPNAHFQDEPAARAWLAERRRQLRS